MSERPAQTETELVAYVRSIDERAPQALHDRIEALVAERSATRGRLFPVVELPGRRPLGAAAAMAAAAVAVVLAVVLGGGGAGSAASLRADSAPTLRPAVLAAPAVNQLHPRQLTAAVDGVAFPYWEEGLGWRSVGERTDRVGTRAVTTVFYADAAGTRIGYAIVAGAAPKLTGGAVSWRAGTAYRLMQLNGAAAVVWLRKGRLCIVSGRGADASMLLRLASWGHGARA
jgi:hypothetical protein